jgi:hypothetical protein
MVNGEFAVDRSSLVSRPRTDEELRAQSALLEAVDDTDVFATVASFKARNKRRLWKDDETRRFFRCLRMYGLDFGMIHTAFPTRKRSQIKYKYFKELRERPALVNAALMCPLPVDVGATRARIKAHIAREKVASQAARVGVGAQHASDEDDDDEEEEEEEEAEEEGAQVPSSRSGRAATRSRSSAASSQPGRTPSLEELLSSGASAAAEEEGEDEPDDDDADVDEEDEDDYAGIASMLRKHRQLSED